MSEWDPWKRLERERERRLWDPWARLEYERERYYSDPWYRFEKDREQYYTDPFFRFEKEMDRLSWDPWYRELRRREWKYDEGNMYRERVLSDLDSKSLSGGSANSVSSGRYSGREIPEWLEIGKIKAWADYYSGPKWLGWVKIGLSVSMIVSALVWYFFFLP